MRISDWSSDVCSSDLILRRLGGVQLGQRLGGVLDALANDLGLAANHRLGALEGYLVGRSNRLEIALLVGDQSLGIKARQLELVGDLGEVELLPLLGELAEVGEGGEVELGELTIQKRGIGNSQNRAPHPSSSEEH